MRRPELKTAGGSKWRGVLLVAGLMAVIAVVAAAHWPVGTGAKPWFSFRTTDGQLVSNATLKGRVTVLDFWATWCGPCMQEMPHMLALYRKYHPKHVLFYGISLDTNPTALVDVLTRMHIPWPMYYDGQGWQNRVAAAWGVHSIPQTYLLGPTGQVLWRGSPRGLGPAIAKAVHAYPHATTNWHPLAPQPQVKTHPSSAPAHT